MSQAKGLIVSEELGFRAMAPFEGVSSCGVPALTSGSLSGSK